jgi:hypothetical protein
VTLSEKAYTLKVWRNRFLRTKNEAAFQNGNIGCWAIASGIVGFTMAGSADVVMLKAKSGKAGAPQR